MEETQHLFDIIITSSIEQCVRSRYGDRGVYFVHTKNNDAFNIIVVKVSENVFLEAFLLGLAKCFNLSAPNYFIPSLDESAAILEKLKPYIELGNEQVKKAKIDDERKEDDEVQGKEEVDLTHPVQFLVMEHVAGVSAREVAFEVDKFQSSSPSHSLLHSIGVLLVYDILIRNDDRFCLGGLVGFPFLGVLGNLGNWMLWNELQYLSVIDPTTSLLKLTPEDFLNYMSLCKEELLQDTDSFTTRLCNTLLEVFPEWKVTTDREYIVKGIKQGVLYIKDLASNNHIRELSAKVIGVRHDDDLKDVQKLVELLSKFIAVW